MKLTRNRLLRSLILPLFIIPLCANAQDHLKRVNVSFNSYFDYDSTQFFKKERKYYFVDNPSTSLEIYCFDPEMAPDSTKLHKYFKQNIEKFETLKTDSAKFDSAMREKKAQTSIGNLKLDRGFYGIYRSYKNEDDIGVFNTLHFEGFNYDEHCYCEFKYNRNFGKDTTDFSDTPAVNEFVSRLVTRSMKDVRAENQAIRDKYTLVLDTLPLENYWIRVYYKKGKMVRDSFFMDDLDSIDYNPRFTHYNITYNANLIFKPHLTHTYVDYYLENTKSFERQNDTFHITMRDAKPGVIRRRGTITILNSLGYPIDLPFYVEYRNHLYEKLRNRRN
ncbi:MAG: hypothetical protein JXR19_03790 [Bacteroidia bacterium]